VSKLGWALIIIGGGLIVFGVRHLSKPAAEPGDPDYDPASDPEFDPPFNPDFDYDRGKGSITEWEQELLKREKEKPYDESDWGSDTVKKTSPSDLNDGV